MSKRDLGGLICDGELDVLGITSFFEIIEITSFFLLTKVSAFQQELD